MDREEASSTSPCERRWEPNGFPATLVAEGEGEAGGGSGPAHLGGNHSAEFRKQHVSGESEEDGVAEGGEPHHPLEVSHVLGQAQAG